MEFYSFSASGRTGSFSLAEHRVRDVLRYGERRKGISFDHLFDLLFCISVY